MKNLEKDLARDASERLVGNTLTLLINLSKDAHSFPPLSTFLLIKSLKYSFLAALSNPAKCFALFLYIVKLYVVLFLLHLDSSCDLIRFSALSSLVKNPLLDLGEHFTVLQGACLSRMLHVVDVKTFTYKSKLTSVTYLKPEFKRSLVNAAASKSFKSLIFLKTSLHREGTGISILQEKLSDLKMSNRSGQVQR